MWPIADEYHKFWIRLRKDKNATAAAEKQVDNENAYITFFQF